MQIAIVNSENVVVYDPENGDDALEYVLNAGEAAGLAIAVCKNEEDWFSFIGGHPINPPTR